MRLNNYLKSTDRIVMSNKEIGKLNFPVTLKSNDKPVGLWYGFGTSWVDWVKSEMPQWIGTYFYKLEVNKNNLIQLNDFIDIGAFSEHYRSMDSDNTRIHEIDWLKVSKDYSGIEINPYCYKARLEMKTIWYYSWDIASGCIWNDNAVKSFTGINTDEIK